MPFFLELSFPKGVYLELIQPSRNQIIYLCYQLWIAMNHQGKYALQFPIVSLLETYFQDVLIDGGKCGYCLYSPSKPLRKSICGNIFSILPSVLFEFEEVVVISTSNNERKLKIQSKLFYKIMLIIEQSFNLIVWQGQNIGIKPVHVICLEGIIAQGLFQQRYFCVHQ